MRVLKYSNLTCPTVGDAALLQAIDHVYANQNRFWNNIEVHVMYSSFGGELNRRQMFAKRVSCLGDAIVLRMEVCATIVGFKGFASKNLKLVQMDDADCSSMEKCRRSRSACRKLYRHTSQVLEIRRR